MLHHIAMFRFRNDVTDETIDDVRSRLLKLPETIDVIREYRVGRDARLSDTTWDMVVFAAFADLEGYSIYSTHPDHVPIVDEVRELVTDRAAVQTTDL